MVDWNMDFLECNVALATRKGWSRSAVPTVGALGERRGLLRASCPTPFGPACGGSKSPPAILSVLVAAPGAWPKARPCWWTKSCPTNQCVNILVHTISHRVARFLERQGVLERDEENSYLQLEGMDEDPMQQLIGCSVSYRIAVGPQQERKVFA